MPQDPGAPGTQRRLVPYDRERAAPALFDHARVAELVQEFAADLVIETGQSSGVGDGQLRGGCPTEDRPQPCERIFDARSDTHGHGVHLCGSFADCGRRIGEHFMCAPIGGRSGPVGAHPLRRGHYSNAGWLNLADVFNYTPEALRAASVIH